MANQFNYSEKLQPPLSMIYTISRIARYPDDPIIFAEISPELILNESHIIEFVLYNPTTGEFVRNLRAPYDESFIEIQELRYNDGKFTKYIVVDFTELDKLFPTFFIAGTFELVINIFVDTIGTEENRKLYIEKISPSRTEVQLAYRTPFDDAQTEELKDFIYKSMIKPDLYAFSNNLLKIANDTKNALLGILAEEVIVKVMEDDPTGGKKYLYDLYSLQSNFQTVITNILSDANSVILEELKSKPERMREDMVQLFIKEKLTDAFYKLQPQFNSNVKVV